MPMIERMVARSFRPVEALPKPGANTGLLVVRRLVCVLLLLLVVPATAQGDVNTQTGAYFYIHTDAVLPANGNRLVFRRAYNSNDPRGGGLGAGWTHNYQMRLTSPEPGSQDVVLVADDGRSDLFTYMPDGAYQPQQPTAESLVRLPDQSYRSQAEGETWTFDPNGRLTVVQISSEPPVTVEQGLSGPIRVLDAGGQPLLSFSYDNDPILPRLIAIADSPDEERGPVEPRSIRFGYDTSRRLSTVTDRAAHTTTYTYEGASTRLTRIIDALGHTAVTLAYNEHGAIASRTDARGLRTGWQSTFAYTLNTDGGRTTEERRVPSSYAPTWRPVTTSVYDVHGWLLSSTTTPDPGDTPEVYTWSWTPEGHSARRTRSGGGTPQPDGVPIMVDTRPAGSAALSVGDPAQPVPLGACVPAPEPPVLPRDLRSWSAPTQLHDPRLEAAVEPGAALQSASLVSVDEYGRLAAFHDGQAAAWHLKYDPEDRLTRIDGPVSFAVEITYDAIGNVVAVQDPRRRTSTFTYDERDSLVEARWATGTVALYSYDERRNVLDAVSGSSDGQIEERATYQHDGLNRIRRVVRRGSSVGAGMVEVTAFGYGDDGSCTAYRSVMPEQHAPSEPDVPRAEEAPILPPAPLALGPRSATTRETNAGPTSAMLALLAGSAACGALVTLTGPWSLLASRARSVVGVMATLGGLLWAALLSLRAIARDPGRALGDLDYATATVLAVVPILLVLLGVRAVRALRATGAGRVGAWGTHLTTAGLLLLLLRTLAASVLEAGSVRRMALAEFGLVVGEVGGWALLALGPLLLGLGLLRAPDFPRWAALACLAVGMLHTAGLVLDGTGGWSPTFIPVLVGLGWAALGFAVYRVRPWPTQNGSSHGARSTDS